MDANLISYMSLSAAQDSARWAMWGVVVSGVSAFASLLTLYFASSALNTWKKQEKTKIRSELKRSLLALDYAIHLMPDGWDMRIANAVHMKIAQMGSTQFVSDEYISAVIEMKKCWHDALSAWAMCEGQLDKTSMIELWNELSDIYQKFYFARANKIMILNKLSEMHSVKFIFD